MPKEESPFIYTPFDTNVSLSLDWVQPVFLGVTKILRQVWLKDGQSQEFCLRYAQVDALSNRILRSHLNIPCNCLRSCSHSCDIASYKASELREFLLYNGCAFFSVCCI